MCPRNNTFNDFSVFTCVFFSVCGNECMKHLKHPSPDLSYYILFLLFLICVKLLILVVYIYGTLCGNLMPAFVVCQIEVYFYLLIIEEINTLQLQIFVRIT